MRFQSDIEYLLTLTCSPTFPAPTRPCIHLAPQHFWSSQTETDRKKQKLNKTEQKQIISVYRKALIDQIC